jgi:hypothetical protein
MFVGGSIFVHHVPIDVSTPIDVGVAATVMSSSMMAAAVVASTVMSAAVTFSTSAVAFCVGRRHHSKSERCGDRKNETNLLQHFCFPPLSKGNHVIALSQ